MSRSTDVRGPDPRPRHPVPPRRRRSTWQPAPAGRVPRRVRRRRGRGVRLRQRGLRADRGGAGDDPRRGHRGARPRPSRSSPGCRRPAPATRSTRPGGGRRRRQRGHGDPAVHGEAVPRADRRLLRRSRGGGRAAGHGAGRAGVDRGQLPVPLIVELSQTGRRRLGEGRGPADRAEGAARWSSATADDFLVLGGQNALLRARGVRPGRGRHDAGERVPGSARRRCSRVQAAASAGARAGVHRLLPLIRFGLQPGIAWAIHKHVLLHRRGDHRCATVRAPGPRRRTRPSAAALARSWHDLPWRSAGRTGAGS